MLCVHWVRAAALTLPERYPDAPGFSYWRPRAHSCLRKGLDRVFDTLESTNNLFQSPGFGLVYELQLVDRFLHLVPHALHLIAHVENYLDTGQIHAELFNEPANLLDLLDVLRRVVANLAFAPCGLDQSEALVMAQRLLVNVHQLGRHADR